MTLKIKEEKPLKKIKLDLTGEDGNVCLLYTSPSPRD